MLRKSVWVLLPMALALLPLLPKGVGSEQVPRRVYEGLLVPMGEFTRPARIETPRVGWVRLERRGLPVLEGRLVAVGQGMLELATAGGELRLAASELLSLTQIEPPQSPEGGERVRILTPGAVWLGTVRERGPDGVLLELSGGAHAQLSRLEGDT